MNIYNIIYKTTNKVNKKIYIGVHSTPDLNDGYLGSGKHLKLAINKYGSDSFTREILHIFETPEEAYRKESEIVNESFVNRKDTYNLKTGGNSFGDGRHSEEAKRKISKANSGKKFSIEHRQKLAESKIGTPRSEYTRKKISDTMKGKPRKQVTCPHCSKTGGEGIMNRWHFHNCSALPPASKF